MSNFRSLNCRRPEPNERSQPNHKWTSERAVEHAKKLTKRSSTSFVYILRDVYGIRLLITGQQ